MLVGVPLDSEDTEDSFAEFNWFVALTTICSGAYRSLDLEIIVHVYNNNDDRITLYLACAHEG